MESLRPLPVSVPSTHGVRTVPTSPGPRVVRRRDETWTPCFPGTWGRVRRNGVVPEFSTTGETDPTKKRETNPVTSVVTGERSPFPGVTGVWICTGDEEVWWGW